MAKFIYIYRGPAAELTPEQVAERMAPFLADSDGKCAVEIFELLSMSQ